MSPVRVALDVDPPCASADQREMLLDALRVRLPDLVVETGGEPAAEVSPGTIPISWRQRAGGCQLELTTPRGSAPLPLGPNAGDDELRAAGVRLAWWLETGAEQPAPAPVVSSAPVLEGADESPEPAAPARAPWLIVGAQYGASWYPGPRVVDGLIRVTVAIPIVDRLQLAVEIRLGTELSIPAPGEDVDVLERSFGVLGRYQERFGSRWTVDVDLGIRYAFPQLEVDGGAEVQIDRSVSNLMLFVGAGAGFDLTSALRLKADVLGAVSVARRRVVIAGAGVSDLGTFNVDAVLGFELVF